MRVGLVAPPWIPVPPPAYGGTESVIANLARGLSERGHEVVLFTVGTSTAPVRRKHLFASPVEPMGETLAEAAHVLAAYEELAGSVDVIHDHTVLGPLVAARSGLQGPPVVVTHHGPFTPVSRAVFREIARSASVVAISHDQARRAHDVPITAVIHHGIDLDAYRPGPGDGGYLVFLGRMSPDKGVATAIRIARAADWPLRLICRVRGPAEEAYLDRHVRPLLRPGEDEIAELGLPERATALGRAAALLNPIAWPEPFGLVMVEALATGTPVLAHPNGASPEIVTPGRTGLLFGSLDEGVAAVHRIAGLDRAACRAEAESRFSLARMAADHERLYERVLDPAHRRPTLPTRTFGVPGLTMAPA